MHGEWGGRKKMGIRDVKRARRELEGTGAPARTPAAASPPGT